MTYPWIPLDLRCASLGQMQTIQVWQLENNMKNEKQGGKLWTEERQGKMDEDSEEWTDEGGRRGRRDID